MFSFLKNHPFSVEAFFESSVVLTFATMKEELQPLIPHCLELDVFNDKWAFVAVAMVQTKELRPRGFPKILGSDFFLIGYRIFVRYTNREGRRLRGLFILKSETNKTRMEFLGNFFTKYQYTTTDIVIRSNHQSTQIKSLQSDFTVEIEMPYEQVKLPENSPFADWKEARKFAGPLPFTFSYEDKTGEVLIIEGVRQNWQPGPVKVIDYHIPFLDSLNLKQIELANAFVINHIPYYWKRGVLEKWTG